MKYTKHFSITVLVLLTLLLTMVTLSYWAGRINPAPVKPAEQTITIGEGSNTETTINLTDKSDSEVKK